MDLPDCPPGAEGYQDSVTEVPKKPDKDEDISSCTKAEQEFQQHLNSLKIKTEDDNYRCMVERRGRDISGKWIYLCYPCAAMCSGESILQTHISGKKHKAKLSVRTVWPLSIFEEHPYEKGQPKSAATEKVLQKMAEEVKIYSQTPSDADSKYEKYRSVRCHIQQTLDNVKTPLVGVEYLVEHPPEESHYEPSYICVLCVKQGFPRTIVNHLTCFWHRYNYLLRHFTKASALLTPYRAQTQYREGVAVIMNRLAARIQDKFGRMLPCNIEKEEYEKDKNQIHQWIFRGPHFSESADCTFEEVVDPDLIHSLDSSKKREPRKVSEPSPPTVAPPSKPNYKDRRAMETDALSDVSDEPEPRPHRDHRDYRSKVDSKRYEPYPDKRYDSLYRSRFALRNDISRKSQEKNEAASTSRTQRPPNYDYKVKLVADMRSSAEELARKALAYHEKNPEKHPLYPEEWKKFWNRRYKEIQAEGKDPSKHDFKPEWIVFWTTRMKELHEEELRSTVTEIYRRMRLTPPDRIEARKSPERRKSPEWRKSLERRKSTERRKSQERRRTPADYIRSSDRRRSPEPRRRSPPRKRSPYHRRNSPLPRRRVDYRDRRTPERRSSPRRRSPLRLLRTRSRSPMQKSESKKGGRARSPLSRRASAPRNNSPARELDTVLISDEELKPDDGLSPWNSEDSLGSLPEARSPVTRNSRTGSVGSRASRRPDSFRDKASAHAPQDFGSAENIVATLRLLVALEDYLGSLGPKIVDLLTEALKMEKEKANSSEELLESEAVVVLIETAKEKLKGAVQAGLVAGGAAAAVRSAVVRAAATLHEADKRMEKKKKQKQESTTKHSSAAVPVAGVGAVDREQIAQQMAAALIAQGKTDVSSEELAQLVEAVVGMAEAKKREAESKKKIEARFANDKSTRAPTANSASALQMLQSAYDDKKSEKEDVPDAMDGLSDSDLETLLKNFNELSAEEQHSLIAYLKKLEAREPQRVERLRQYVGEAATSSTAVEKTPAVINVEPVAIESDDDDYTVEDVFKSATQKVKENQIRQEMEIVKKSLEEESKVDETPVTASSSQVTQNNMFSATDLLALVQASLQSTAPGKQAQTLDVVSSNTHPRSFGDLPEPSVIETSKPSEVETSQPLQTTPSFNNQPMSNQGLLGPPHPMRNYGENQDEVQTPVWEPREASDNINITNQGNMFNQGPRWLQDSYNQNSRSNYDQNQQDNYNNQGPRGNQAIFNQGPRNSPDNFNNGSQGPLDIYNQGSRRVQDNFNQRPQEPQDNFNQGPQGPPDNFNQGPRGPQDDFNQGPQGPPDNFSQGPRGPQDNFNQGPQGPPDNFSQGPRGLQDNFNQGLRGPQVNFSQGSRGLQDNFNQGPRGPQDNFNQGPQGPFDNFNQGSRGLLDNFSQGSDGPQNNFNSGSQGPQDNFNLRPRGPLDSFNLGSRGPQDNYNQGQRGFQENYNNGPQGAQENFDQDPLVREGALDNYNLEQRASPDNFNQGMMQGSQNNFTQGARGSQDNYNQGMPSLLGIYNPSSRGQDKSHGAQRGGNNNKFNQGSRVNFNNRQDGNQQQFGGQKFGNFENKRGRGRGQRGRGRGYY